MRELTQDEKDTFGLIVDAPDESLALVSTEFDGEETAVIVAVVERGDNVDMHPLAVLVTEGMFDRLTPPTEPDAIVDSEGNILATL